MLDYSHMTRKSIFRSAGIVDPEVTKWDERFLEMTDLVGGWSKDPSTKVGAVIVREDKTVASVGYNGFPRGMSDDAGLYADRPTKYSRIVHGEMNAILNAHGTVTGCTLFVPMLCCDRCAVHVIQAGIKRVVCRLPSEDMQSRWGDAFEQTRAMFKEAGVEVMEYPLDGEPTRCFVSKNKAAPTHAMRIHVSLPSVDGQRVASSITLTDIFMLGMKIDLSTDERRLEHVAAVAKSAANLALGIK